MLSPAQQGLPPEAQGANTAPGHALPAEQLLDSPRAHGSTHAGRGVPTVHG